ncbi:glycosyl hydrolase family 18 protein [Bacillus sp. 03113]|uniref:glycosyl hydrolase family 18 protein n=1 Tax=Bacillus sp. 03113 TaxID=2578211 RepID=UPI0011429B0E|nr:glycosyl hydrolase family 18 protein [Bacillus sp. 03113]
MGQIEVNKRNTMSRKGIIFGLILAFLLITSSLYFLFNPLSSHEKVDYFSGENPVIFKGKQEANAIIEKETVFLPVDFVKKYIDKSIFYDQQSTSIIITTKDKVIQMPTESLTYFINQEPVELQFPPLKDKDGKLYMSLNLILDYYPIQYSILPHTNAVKIDMDGDVLKMGMVTDQNAHKGKLRLRTKPSLRSPYTEDVNKNDSLFVEKQVEDYYFVRKENGVAGFIQKNLISIRQTNKVVIKHEQKEAVLTPIQGPIQLTWEAVYKRNPDPSKIGQMPGVNVVSPTWFKLDQTIGNVKNMGSLDYVNWAKARGYQVWGLFSNDFNPTLTHEAFKDFQTRQQIIRQLLLYSQNYQLNGINIDIENVQAEDGPLVTQFVREATPYFHEAGLLVSMDITFITEGNWSAFYEREHLAEIVDYLIVMAYDEHWASSPKAGSVASFPWVEENLQKLLKIVPPQKLILGVPLYSRLWEQHADGKLNSKALSMDKVKEWLDQYQIQASYDEDSGQNYAEYVDGNKGITYKIWLEDDLSLQKRAGLAAKYNLAGIASWSRSFAAESAWTALSLEKAVAKK